MPVLAVKAAARRRRAEVSSLRSRGGGGLAGGLPPRPPFLIALVGREYPRFRAADRGTFGVADRDIKFYQFTANAGDFNSDVHHFAGAHGFAQALRGEDQAQAAVARELGAENAGDGNLEQAAGDDDVGHAGKAELGGFNVGMDRIVVAREGAVAFNVFAGEDQTGFIALTGLELGSGEAIGFGVQGEISRLSVDYIETLRPNGQFLAERCGLWRTSG